ncbi:thiamine pyrophosphokinase [Oikeobacillus pervagus]|uniref:Thiamine diphosphokinase n=1 Tax=Oikeobacillus pervagus TaxID=1325931 RepID=A0AAJ1T0Q6_9BACI|nr:thiamine diphosphokinase [Oikeobacillus pervagus]MDQ0215082.1 thiamine pyrophosphokinase [Oikeobacillus pervagus]
MQIGIVAGGPKRYIPELMPFAKSDWIWVGVDRGVYYLLENGIRPNVAFGDFDSVTKKEWQEIQEKVTDLKKYKPEKDETDMELALVWAFKQRPEKVYIFGATGGRLDHFLANIGLLVREEWIHDEIQFEMVDKTNRISVYTPGTYELPRHSEMKYISFVPVTPIVKEITLKGFKYPLTNKTIRIGSTLCISNELVEKKGTFSFSDGILIMIRSRDERL